jgi:hypothetical protein
MALMLVGTLGAAQAGDYVCEVNCKSNGGSIEKIYVTVSSGSRSDAASYLDARGHEVCRKNGYANATSSTMSESQCRSK